MPTAGKDQTIREVYSKISQKRQSRVQSYLQKLQAQNTANSLLKRQSTKAEKLAFKISLFRKQRIRAMQQARDFKGEPQVVDWFHTNLYKHYFQMRNKRSYLWLGITRDPIQQVEPVNPALLDKPEDVKDKFLELFESLQFIISDQMSLPGHLSDIMQGIWKFNLESIEKLREQLIKAVQVRETVYDVFDTFQEAELMYKSLKTQLQKFAHELGWKESVQKTYVVKFNRFHALTVKL